MVEQSAARHYFNPQPDTLSDDCTPLFYMYLKICYHINVLPRTHSSAPQCLSASAPSVQHHLDDTPAVVAAS